MRFSLRPEIFDLETQKGTHFTELCHTIYLSCLVSLSHLHLAQPSQPTSSPKIEQPLISCAYNSRLTNVIPLNPHPIPSTSTSYVSLKNNHSVSLNSPCFFGMIPLFKHFKQTSQFEQFGTANPNEKREIVFYSPQSVRSVKSSYSDIRDTHDHGIHRKSFSETCESPPLGSLLISPQCTRGWR